MRAMRIDTLVFAPLPIENRRSNSAVVNQILNPLVASLGALANLFYD